MRPAALSKPSLGKPSRMNRPLGNVIPTSYRLPHTMPASHGVSSPPFGQAAIASPMNASVRAYANAGRPQARTAHSAVYSS